MDFAKLSDGRSLPSEMRYLHETTPATQPHLYRSAMDETALNGLGSCSSAAPKNCLHKLPAWGQSSCRNRERACCGTPGGAGGGCKIARLLCSFCSWGVLCSLWCSCAVVLCFLSRSLSTTGILQPRKLSDIETCTLEPLTVRSVRGPLGACCLRLELLAAFATRLELWACVVDRLPSQGRMGGMSYIAVCSR
jgi:hypothetical protein